MNSFVRRRDLDVVFNDMHGVKPTVSVDFVNTNKYRTKFEHNSKEIILTEILERGLTKSVVIQYDGKEYPFRTYYDAEVEISKILKG